MSELPVKIIHNRKVKWVDTYPKVCPKCGEKIIIQKYNSGIDIYCKYYCPREDDDPICDPSIKCSECEYFNDCGGCKIPKGKACNYEDERIYV